MIRSLTGVLCALVACGPSVSAGNGETATDTDAPTRFDVPPQDIPEAECVFEETTLPPEAEPGRCSGRTEAQCEAEGCLPVYGREVTQCTTDGRTECVDTEVFLGCGQVSICKFEAFICSRDGLSVYATNRLCIPPTGWVPCYPGGAEQTDFDGQC